MDIVVFGTGQYCKSRISCFERDNVIAFLDNNAKEGDVFFDIPVFKPNAISSLKYDAVCLMAGAQYAEEMFNQLIMLGVDPDRIYVNDRCYFKKKKNKTITTISNNNLIQNRAVVFVPNLANTGGVRAAMYAMKTLKEKYRRVTVVSPCDGVLKESIVNGNYDIIITSDISEENVLLWELINDAEIIILNGLYYGYLVETIKKLTTSTVLWWLHTGESFYKTYPIPHGDMETEGVIVAGVSEMVCDAYRNHNHNREIELLPYGIPDEATKEIGSVESSKDKIVFAIIGTISKVKGIDVFLEAISKLEADERKKAEFWIIGSEVNRTYANELHSKYDSIYNVKWVGEKKHDDIMEMYNQIDVLVSSSREDMLPIVTIEAMMHSKPCILSDAVGTVGFIEDGKQGLIFPNGNSDELVACIKKIINNKEVMHKMGLCGRRLFEEKFSEEMFKRELIRFLEKRIENIPSL